MNIKKILLAVITPILIAPLLSNSPSPDPIPNYGYENFSYELTPIKENVNDYQYELSYENSGDNFVYLNQHQFKYSNKIFQNIIIEPFSVGTYLISSEVKLTKETMYYQPYEINENLSFNIFNYTITLLNDEKNMAGFYVYNIDIELKDYDSQYYYFYIFDIDYRGDLQHILSYDSKNIYTKEKINIDDLKINNITLLQGRSINNYGYYVIFGLIVGLAATIVIFSCLLIAGLVVLIVFLVKKNKNKPKENDIKQNE